MKWRKKPPDCIGYWWQKSPGKYNKHSLNGRHRIVEIKNKDGKFIYGESVFGHMNTAEMSSGYLWSGPIQVPDEK